MNTVTKILAERDRLVRLQEKRAKVQGAIELLHSQLREDFDCETVADAEKKLTRLRKKKENAEKEVGEMVEDFKKEFADVLD